MRTAIIVGRFQVPELHEGHHKLITTAMNECERVHVFVGYDDKHVYSTADRPAKYPYTYNQTHAMLRKAYPNVIGNGIPDMETDEEWWERLERVMIQSEIYEYTLYGSRDSFISNYKGKMPVRYVDEVEGVSGTKVRAELKEKEEKKDDGNRTDSTGEARADNEAWLE